MDSFSSDINTSKIQFRNSTKWRLPYAGDKDRRVKPYPMGYDGVAGRFYRDNSHCLLRSDLTSHLERCKGYASDASKPSNKSSDTPSFIRTRLTRQDKVKAAQGTTETSQLFFDINRTSNLILTCKNTRVCATLVTKIFRFACLRWPYLFCLGSCPFCSGVVPNVIFKPP